ncbi:LPXTG cell wall anchor domain-containing protein [Nocardioides sp. dk4132]|uniref:copper resistance CopC family protein n=1 Tax=unclassified Nocardioides TaxID=2615069 RepID=UPI001297A49A|nr:MULTISPECIES: copper resistance CopC family protein [unclassified Nocardioides]MQW74984.1 LPXTG cell wall anchor domain-containing protein [Nocardioides sp. dk4132]QGA09679.1 LPXTG cell wall anchor domain-containing protein [Nocardioides sp. dk884]
MGLVISATDHDGAALSPLFRALVLPPLVLAVWLLVWLVVWLGGAPAPPAAAHASLVSSDPAEASLVETLPSRAVLSFTSPILEVHELTVTGPDGDVVNGEATLAEADVRQNLWAGPDGDYVMVYDVVAADGHEISGEVRFEVGPLAAQAPAASGPDGSDATGPRLWEQPSPLLLAAGLVVLGVGGSVLVRRRRASGP